MKFLPALVLLPAFAFFACSDDPGDTEAAAPTPDAGTPVVDAGTSADGGKKTSDAGATAGLALSVHTTLGIPEAATVADPSHALLVKPQYVMSFDGTRKVPRWTSWELTTAWLGSTTRSPTFVADAQLPDTIPQSSDADYTRTGFDRGHLCPSGDRTDSTADNLATFVYTNVVPQTVASNTGTWKSLETEERALTQAGNHLFIIAGSIFATTPPATIGSGVAVPTSMFKVVVVMSGDHPLPSDVTTSTRIITVDIPNTTTVSGSYTGYRVKLADVETKTGFRLLSDVAPAVHDALASVVDAQ